MGALLSVGPPLELTQYDLEDMQEHCDRKCARPASPACHPARPQRLTHPRTG